MAQSSNNSRGAALAARLFDGRRQAEHAALPGTRDLPKLQGITSSGHFKQPQENVITAARDIVLQSGRCFRYGNAVVLETGEGSDRRLVELVTDYSAAPAASSLLANIFHCETGAHEEGGVQFAPPKSFVELLFNNEPTQQSLPLIKLYSRRPVFDERFVLRDPGWHPEAGILVHSAGIEPVLTGPRRLDELLQDFCFRDAADRANFIAVLLTGLLMPAFISRGKPVVLLDGNQPSVGKTLLSRAIGIVLDGTDPRLIHYSPDDEELAKRICATLRSHPQSVLIVDNAKLRAGTSVTSPVIEANSMAPEISLRILGQSSNYTRPNDLIWALTMNDIRTSPDLVSRGLPVRFRFEGDPRNRTFDGRDPISYATEHRCEILNELAGMIIRWVQAGQPLRTSQHRCTYWAEVIGGIMDANDLPDFLTNLEEAAGQFDVGLDELAALVEAAAELHDGPVCLLS